MTISSMLGGGEMTAVESVLPVGATLGEGPVWHDGALWFVDIKRHRVYRFDPATRTIQEWEAPDQVGWVLPTAAGGWIAGVRTGIHAFDPATGAFTLLHDPEPDWPTNRLNDAATDPWGRVWFGTMDNGEAAVSGRVYRLGADGVADSGLAPVAITNGPAISADGGLLYHVDTLGRTIWKVALGRDGLSGTPEIFVRIEDGAGHPDGAVVDAEGCVWVGLFGGWGVRRYDPAGMLIATVRFPVANITKIAFGGADLTTAYATTARMGLDAAALAAQPLAGNLFTFDAGVAGVRVTPAKL